MTESFRFSTRSGRVILLEPAHAVRPLDDGANTWRTQALREDRFGAAAIARARNDSWSTSRDLVMVDLGVSPSPGRAVWISRDEVLVWDEIPMLSELRRKDGGLDPPVQPVSATDPRDAWMSFDVVDDRGLPADGEFHGIVDGAKRGGLLERCTHSFRDLSSAAVGSVQLGSLSFPTVTMSLDGPVPGGMPTAPDDVSDVCTSFEVVDDEGRPVVGRYVVRAATGERSGSSGGIASIDVAGPASVRISVDMKAAYA